jgi:Ca2+-binding EF-hand superfamily protein
MDFNNNGMTISEFAFTGLGDELADRNEIPSAHYVYEEIDAINNQDRIKNIINEYVKDRGELKDLRDIFGNEQGAAHNVNYSEDGLTMTITQNGKTVIVNYDKETGAITFENLDDLTALLIRNNDTDADGNISRQELASIITGESTDVDQTFLSYLTGKLTAQAGGNDALLSKEELSGLLDQNTDGIVTQEEIDAFNSAIKGRVSVMKEMFDSIDSDQDGSISKDNFITGLKNNQGLKADANANLVSYMFDDLIRPMAGDDGNISKEEFMAALDRNGNGVFEQEEIDGFDAVLQTKVDVINNAQEWQGCGNTQGYIDWNKDGRFDNEIDHYGSYIARHGHMDTFFNRFDYNWGGYQINNLNDILEDYDNKSSRDMDQRAGFVSDGTVTVHKISDTQIGFNVTEYDQAKAAGVDYNYVVWDKEKRTFLIGQDLNNDGNLTDAEIMGIVENVGIRTSSPLTFDLNGDGKVSTTGISKEYDINGDGIVDQTAWAGAGDGVLAFDADGDGIIGEDGKELFGNNTDVDGNGKADGFKNGFEALGALASRYLGAEALKDGKLDATELKQLELRAGLSMFVDGTQKSLSDLGISEISLGYEEVAVDESRDENGNEHRQIGEGFVINGQKAKVDDVWFQYAA